jgi:hypothetical protein
LCDWENFCCFYWIFLILSEPAPPTQKPKEATLKNDESNVSKVPQRYIHEYKNWQYNKIMIRWNLLISNIIRTLIAPKVNERTNDGGPSLLRTPLIQPLQVRELPETPSILKGIF